MGITQHPGGVTTIDGTPSKYFLYGMGKEGYCKDVTVPRIRSIRPHVYGVLLDTFMLFPWYVELDYSPARTLFYYPSDGGGGLPKNCDHVLRKCNVPVSMSKFAQKQVKDCHNIDAKYIPHAVDHKIYYPLSKEERQALRKSKGLENKYVVGVVARNQPRKMLDRTIKAVVAFAKFAKENGEARLLLHCDPDDQATMFDLRSLALRLGIENRVVWTGMKYYQGFDYKTMNEIYNCMDVFLLTTSGEGWGVPMTEAMAAEIPVVATLYTTTEEMVVNHKAGLGVKLVGCEEVTFFDKNSYDYDLAVMNGTITGSWEVERGIMDVNDCAHKLQLLYDNPSMRTEMGANGRKAVLEEYTWEKVINEWDALLSSMVSW